MSPKNPRARPAHVGPLIGAAALAIVAASAGRYDMALHRQYDPDEFQHLHAAWCISTGLVPYRDFYEHHMPALPALAAAVLPMSAAGTRLEDAQRVLWLARGFMWAWSLLTVALTWALGHRLGGPALGATAAALLSGSIIFTGKGMEVRPDGPATACWLASLLLLTVALERPRGRRWLLMSSGFALGLALLFTQKLLLAGPGLAVVSVWSWVRYRDVRRPASPLIDSVAQLGGVALPAIAAAAWFASHGAASAFLHATVLQNLAWAPELAAGSTLAWLGSRDPALASLGAIGLATTALTLRAGSCQPGRVVVVCAAASLALGLFLIPTPYPQYLLPMLPLLAVCGADALLAMTRPVPWRGLAAGVAALVFCLAWAQPQFVTPWAYPALFTGAALLAMALMRRRPYWAAAGLLGALSVYQAQQLRWMQGLTSDAQMAAMAEVHRLTAGERDTVLDGFTGYGWFRMHAWRYPFLHAGVRARLSDADRRELAEGLGTGRIAPGAVLFDRHLQAISAEVAQAIGERFQPADIEPVWRPRQR